MFPDDYYRDGRASKTYNEELSEWYERMLDRGDISLMDFESRSRLRESLRRGMTPFVSEDQIDVMFEGERLNMQNFTNVGINPRIISFREGIPEMRFSISGMRGWFGWDRAHEISRERRRQ